MKASAPQVFRSDDRELGHEAGGGSPEGARLDAGTVLAFDFGEKRIGVAVGDLLVGIAHPAGVIDRQSNDERFAAIQELVDEWQPRLFVVGLPLHMDGTEHHLTRLARKFARRLEARFRLPARLVDERLTSYAAQEALREAGVRGSARRPLKDSVAAQIILQAYLDGDAGS